MSSSEHVVPSALHDKAENYPFMLVLVYVISGVHSIGAVTHCPPYSLKATFIFIEPFMVSANSLTTTIGIRDLISSMLS